MRLSIKTPSVSAFNDGRYVGVFYVAGQPERESRKNLQYLGAVEVAHDSEIIYFLVEADGDVVQRKPGSENWMTLFIGI